MKLGHKLLLAPLLTAVVALAAGGINTALMAREAAEAQRDAQDRAAAFKGLAGARVDLGQVQGRSYRLVALIASLDEAQVKVQRDDLARQLADAQGRLATAVEGAGSDETLKVAVTTSKTQADAFLKAIDAAIDLASVDPNTGVAALQQADAAFAALSKTVDALVGRIEARASEALAEADARSSRNTLLLSLIGLLAAAAAVGLSWRMQRAMVAELSRAARVADAVAGGDLTVLADSQRADEVGDLLRSLDRMAGGLNQSLGTVREAAHSIHTASAEIANGNFDLSQRTEQAASNLQQTASSMVTLTATVRQSADSAATANSLAGTAAQVAQRGGSVVGQVVSTMDEINTSSRRIADIIGVIDGIAFQTNILALNAAVEAARAGEQGRGFAVVAAEVRSLAQRSAGAAKEIKLLIDASVGKVDAGSRQVQDAGATMTEIVASVQRVTDIMGEISASTIAQSQGIGTVNDAVVQLDQMTQQNAALVEQSAAAAGSMKDQATRLSDLVNGFKLR